MSRWWCLYKIYDVWLNCGWWLVQHSYLCMAFVRVYCSFFVRQITQWFFFLVYLQKIVGRISLPNFDIFFYFFVLFCIRLYSILLCVSIRCIFSRYYFVQKNQHRPDRLLTIFKNIELIWCSLGVVQKLNVIYFKNEMCKYLYNTEFPAFIVQ